MPCNHLPRALFPLAMQGTLPGQGFLPSRVLSIDDLRKAGNQLFVVAFLSRLDGASGITNVFCPHFFKKMRTNCVG